MKILSLQYSYRDDLITCLPIFLNNELAIPMNSI